MQFNVNTHAVSRFNLDAKTIRSCNILEGKTEICVETYIDYYGSENARLIVNGSIVDTQWNGGLPAYLAEIPKRYANEIGSWNLPDKFEYPRRISQYKFRNLVGGLARSLWDMEEDE
tara:strand:- start:540 stop:890 length:351 start_codon:yes stop_codon:yes gene_type:complete